MYILKLFAQYKYFLTAYKNIILLPIVYYNFDLHNFGVKYMIIIIIIIV